MLKILSAPKDLLIHPAELKVGEIAEIVKWAATSYVGSIVTVISLEGQKFLLSLSDTYPDVNSSSFWTFKDIEELKGNPDFQVRVLPKGTSFVID